MLRRPDYRRLTESSAGRRRWRRGWGLGSATAAGAPPASDSVERPWSLDEVGADAVELGLVPEWCLLEDPLVAGQR